MKNIYDKVNSLDKKCYDKYFLSEDILMEHAALGIYNHIISKFINNQNILIVCGSGNNGADGLVLARLLYKQFHIEVYLSSNAKSKIAKLQKKRTKSLGINFIKDITDIKYDLVIDCLFGSGLNKSLNSKYINIINKMNNIKAYKIACDIPSGININGQIENICFKADSTITMGAYKRCLFSDYAKNFVGDIIKVDLGLDSSFYEEPSNIKLLEKSDLKIPIRTNKNTNKGSFGHLAIVLGNKKGAGLISCNTAISFGVGLVTAITDDENISYSLMYSNKLPTNTTAIAIGMGLGNNFDKSILNNDLPILFDADILYNPIILKHLHKNNIVLTPHPKEFCALLKLCNIDDIDIPILQNDRFLYLNKFCTKYPNVIVLLKGANTLIQQNKTLFINPLGTSALSFGGSGDILAGLISSLMAQGYNSLNATIQGTLAHTIAALNYKGNNYSLNVDDLIKQIKIL